MKPESLESLLIDRSLNELDPEVMELLDDYLAQNPDPAVQAAAVAATWEHARQATAVPRVPPRHALRIDRWQRAALHSQVWRGPWAEIIRLAACLALGLAVGWTVHSARRTAVSAQVPGVNASAERPRVAAKPSAPEFWSVAYLLEKQRVKPVTSQTHDAASAVPWETLVK